MQFDFFISAVWEITSAQFDQINMRCLKIKDAQWIFFWTQFEAVSTVFVQKNALLLLLILVSSYWIGYPSNSVSLSDTWSGLYWISVSIYFFFLSPLIFLHISNNLLFSFSFSFSFFPSCPIRKFFILLHS